MNSKEITWLRSKDEISDLIKNNELFEVIERVEVEKYNLPWHRAGKRCDLAAEKFARKKGYDTIFCSGYTEFFNFPGSIIAGYSFYKKVKPKTV